MPNVYSGDLTKMFDLTGKKAVIFGGAGGFGKAIAEGYAANGADVLILSRREDALKEAVKEIEAKKAANSVVKYFVCDASKESEVIAARDFCVSKEGLGGCDILVNSQGINKKMFSWEIDNDFWDKMMDTNITSLMYTCRYFGNWMKENNTADGVKYNEKDFES